MKLLVGLGNPGKKYARNRHNIGFMAVDDIAKAHSFGPWRSRFKGEVAEGLINGLKCLLLKPHTFMNLSGEAVREAAQFYKIPLENIIVFHDEIDLAASKVKVKTDGGNAGHNGLKSISSHLGNAYVRVRLGVGRPANKVDVPHYVLRDFAKADHIWLEELLCVISRHIGVLVAGPASDFMSKVAQDMRPISAPQDGTPSQKADDEKPSKTLTPKKLTLKQQALAEKKPQSDKKSALGAALDKWLGSTPPKGDN